MKALSIHSPWAWAILAGYKRVENRTWSTSYRGTLAIHAGVSKASDPVALALFAKLGIEPPADFDRGALIGTVELVDVVPLSDLFVPDWVKVDPFTSGPVCLILENPRPLRRPVACRGALGLFNVPDTLLG